MNWERSLAKAFFFFFLSTGVFGYGLDFYIGPLESNSRCIARSSLFLLIDIKRDVIRLVKFSDIFKRLLLFCPKVRK
jgi:hypothetical protein